jgi:CRISPR-associated protein Csm1
VIQLADRLSSKERGEHEEGEPPTKQLISIFGRVYRQKDFYLYPLQPLSISREGLFPNKEEEAKTPERYSSLWRSFTDELRKAKELVGINTYALLTTLYYLLEKYTWCIPSAYYEALQDISLFDHLRSTCAIALGLHRSGIPDEALEALLKEDSMQPPQRTSPFWKEPYLSLIGGDVSGLQRFLYTQTSRGVAKGLRGRSFYLELLTEVAALWVLKRLSLPLASLVYAGGGHFYILANCIGEEKLEELRRDFGRALLSVMGGELYLALAAVDVAPEDFEDFGRVWSSLTQRLGETKRRRFAELPLDELHREVFTPQGEGDPDKTCVVCRREAATLEREGDRWCLLCDSLERLGRLLADARYLLIAPTTGEEATRMEEWQRLFLELGFKVCLLQQIDRHTLRELPEGGLLLCLNSTDFLNDKVTEAIKEAANPPALGFRFFANVTPRKEGGREIAEFGDMAERSQGIERLGVLRMDVDDLGRLFREGFKEGERSISRIASLSLLLKLFFEGWMNSLGEEFKDTIYTIYSGGDDLFIVGSWSDIPKAARRIQEEFSAFTCNNPDVHISGGIVVEDPHFPLYQFAREAGDALDGGAKKREGKNAISFLEYTMSWTDLAEIEQRCCTLRRLVEEEKAPRALLHRLMAFYERFKEAQGGAKWRGTRYLDTPPKVCYGPWLWQAAYHLDRMIERLEEGRAREELEGIRQALIDPGLASKELPRWALAARWAELLLREEEQ